MKDTRERIVDVPGVKLCHIIEENTDSISSSVFINKVLEKYMIFEEVENEVFEKIETLIEGVYELNPDSVLSELIEIRDRLKTIDKNQDKYIERIVNLSLYIGEINRRSNGILKFYDVAGPYKKYRGRSLKVRQPTIWEGEI